MNRRFLILNWMDIKNPNAGGQEKYCFEIGRRLARDGMKVYWISSKFPDSMSRETVENIEIIRTGNIYTVFLGSFFKYLKYRKNSYFFLSMNAIPFFIPFSKRRRIVMLYHRIDINVMKEKAGKLGYLSFFLQEHIMPMLFRNDHVITDSPSSKLDFDSTGYKNISIVKLGVDLPETHSFKKKKLCISPGPVKPWKHHDLVVKAFSRMPADWELSVFGSFESDEYRNVLYNICSELGIQERVHLLGKISEEEMKELYEYASICILGTEKEGWGLVAMEAQSFGCPVVAFDVPGIRDSVVNGKTGVLTKFGDVTAMANALLDLSSNDKLLREMGENAVKRSREYGWEACYDEFRQELQRIIPDI